MLNTIRAYLEGALTRTSEALTSANRTLNLWIFGDLIYAVLPLLVLAAITALLGQSFEGFLRIKEWSFATIIFFGVSIRNLVRLKVRIQHTPKSYKLDTGVQMYVMLLIASVLVLALVILSEKNVLPTGHEKLLSISQFMLFCIGGLSLLMSVEARDVGINWAKRGTDPASTTEWRLRQVNRELSNTEERLSYLADAIANFPQKASAGSEGDTRLHDDKRATSIAFSTLERISAMTKDIECNLERVLAGKVKDCVDHSANLNSSGKV